MCLQLLTGTVIKNQFLICGLVLGNILSRVDFFFFSCLGSPHREMPTHASILAWRISWAEETGGLQSMGSHRVRHTHSPPVHLWRITCGRRHSFTHLSSTQELYAERSYRAGSQRQCGAPVQQYGEASSHLTWRNLLVWIKKNLLKEQSGQSCSSKATAVHPCSQGFWC